MVRLSKKGLILIFVLIAVVLGATGYLAWRVNSEANLSPDESAAAPPDVANCGGCAGKGMIWKVRKGECKKVEVKSGCGKGDDTVIAETCGGDSAAGCRNGGRPGSTCRDTGKCVNVSGKADSEGKVQCQCQGVKIADKPDEVDTNSCEGGALSTPAAGDTGTVGEPITISGYAFDADGINNSTIKVTVDGNVVGTATATDACPSGNTSVCTSVGSAKKPVVWTYSFTPTEQSHDISVSWADSEGATGSACTKSTTLTSAPKEITNANWSLSSAATGISCQNTGGTNVSGVVNYTVTVKNVGNAQGTLSRVEVVLDDAVEDSFIMTENISPSSATVSGNVITWNLSGSAATFAVDQSKTYTFSLDLPKASYGVLSHDVTIVPSGEGAENVEQVLSSTVACTDDGEVPQTGIFDSAIGQIVFSITLISLGYLYLKGYDRGVLNVLGGGYRKMSDSYISVFGEQARVDRSRRKFEKKMK